MAPIVPAGLPSRRARKKRASQRSKEGCLRSRIMRMSRRNCGTHWRLPAVQLVGEPDELAPGAPPGRLDHLDRHTLHLGSSPATVVPEASVLVKQERLVMMEPWRVQRRGNEPVHRRDRR